MKITEVRNKLFGLSDLKGLIKEYREGPWPGFFKEDPTRLDVHFNELMGLRAWLEKNGISVPNSKAANALLASLTPEQIEDIKDTVGVDISPIRKYFGDEVFLNALRDSGNFRKPGNNYSPFRSGFIQAINASNGKQRERYKAKKAKQANANLVQPEVPQDSIDRPTTLKPEYNNVELLRDAFNELGGNEIQIPDFQNRENIINYVETINNLSKDVTELVKNKYGKEINDFTINKFLPGTETNPFYFFLLFYYFYNRESGAKMLPQYIGNIKNPDVKDCVETLLFPKEETKLDLLIREVETFLSNFNITITDGITDEVVDICSKNIPDLYNIALNVMKINQTIIGEYTQTACGLILSLLYILQMGPTTISDNVVNAFSLYMPGDGYKFLRCELNRFRYTTLFNKNKQGKQFGKIIKKVAESYGFSDDHDIFDPLSVATREEVKNAVINAEREGLSFVLLDSIEIPSYDSKNTLNRFERFVLFVKELNELLSENATKYYGGSNIVNKETMFIDAGMGLVLLKEGKLDKKKYQRIEDLSKTENAVENKWCFYDLLSEDYFGRDKTQRAIYNFLRVNTNPDSVKWTYEYNRKTQSDVELNPKSIDILCEYGSGVASFEYQGEQHYRPQGVTPKDDVEDAKNSPNVSFFNEMKKAIIDEYLKRHNERTTSNKKSTAKWEIAEIYMPVIMETFEKKFGEMVGESFSDVYHREIKRAGYLSQMPQYRKLLKEAQKDRDRNKAEIVKYMFCVLCRYNGLPLPIKFKKSTVSVDVFEQPKLETDIVYLASPYRFRQELHVYFSKISDADKSDLIKRRGWAAIYITPPIGRISNDDIKFTKTLANPSDAVFEWTDGNKQKILDFAKQIGIPVQEEEIPDQETDEINENMLFKEIISEIIRDYNLL